MHHRKRDLRINRRDRADAPYPGVAVRPPPRATSVSCDQNAARSSTCACVDPNPAGSRSCEPRRPKESPRGRERRYWPPPRNLGSLEGRPGRPAIRCRVDGVPDAASHRAVREIAAQRPTIKGVHKGNLKQRLMSGGAKLARPGPATVVCHQDGCLSRCVDRHPSGVRVDEVQRTYCTLDNVELTPYVSVGCAPHPRRAIVEARPAWRGRLNHPGVPGVDSSELPEEPVCRYERFVPGISAIERSQDRARTTHCGTTGRIVDRTKEPPSVCVDELELVRRSSGKGQSFPMIATVSRPQQSSTSLIFDGDPTVSWRDEVDRSDSRWTRDTR